MFQLCSVAWETFVLIKRLGKQDENMLAPLAEGPGKKDYNCTLADIPVPASRKAMTACASKRLKKTCNIDWKWQLRIACHKQD